MVSGIILLKRETETQQLEVQISKRQEITSSWALYIFTGTIRGESWLTADVRSPKKVLNIIASELLQRQRMGWQVSYPSSELEKVIKKEMKRVQKILLTKPEPTLQTLTFSKQHKDAFRLVLKLEDYKPSFFNIVYVVSCRLLEYKVSKEILNDLADEGYIEQLVNSYKFTKKGLEAALAIGVINPFRYEHLLRKKRKK